MTESAVERPAWMHKSFRYPPSSPEAVAARALCVPGPDWVPNLQAENRRMVTERAELLAAVERMRNKVEGLDSDLRCAVQVAYLRGATEWAKRNYPGMIEWLESCVTARATLTTGEATTPNAGVKP